MNLIIKNILLLSMLVFGVSALAAKAPQRTIEEGIEGTPTLVFIGKSLTGKLHVKACDDENCPLLKLNITPQTKAFYDRKPVSLSSRIESPVKPELTIYDVNTNNVIRLYWYSR